MRYVFNALFFILASLMSVTGQSQDILINFDELPVGIVNGDQYLPNGVIIATGKIPETTTVGSIIEFSDRDDQFYVLDIFAPSEPNLLVPSGYANQGFEVIQDILFELAEPAKSFSLDLDLATSDGNGPDFVRLLALQPTGESEYTVVELDESLDSSVNLVTLTVSSETPFSSVVFHQPEELEGIDNIRIESLLIGDVNLDRVVNLLDVGPFVDLISSGQYQVEADTNQDDAVNLLDVDTFIDLLSGC